MQIINFGAEPEYDKGEYNGYQLTDKKASLDGSMLEGESNLIPLGQRIPS